MATALAAELDLLVVRKIGVPAKPELAAGAIVDADPPELVFNDAVMAKEVLDEDDLAPIIERERQELHRRRSVYCRHGAFPALTGRSVVLVDDGAATGTTMLAAIRAVRRRAPGHLIVALPVADRQTVDLFLREGVETVCLEMPERLRAVGLHYRSFEQLDDRTVLDLLDRSPRRPVD